MVRDIYYQSAGNPLQFDRLPSRWPQVAFRHHAPPLSRTAAIVFKLLLGGLATVVLTTAVIAVSTSYRFLDEAILLGVIVILAIHATKKWDPAWLTTPLPAVLIIYGCLSAPLPSAMLILICSVTLGRLTWHFGRHWTGTSTTSPLPRETGRRLRQRWNGYLLVVALLPLVASIVGIVIGSVLLAVLLVTCLVLVQTGHATFHRRRATIPRTIVSSLASWLTYNRHNSVLPGMFRSPAGTWYGRIVWSLATVSLVTITGIRLAADAAGRRPYEAAMPSNESVASMPAFDTEDTHQMDTRRPFVPIGGVALLMPVLFGCVVPMVVTIAIPLGLTLPILVEAGSYRRNRVTPDRWGTLVRDIQTSYDPIERRSLYQGHIVADGSPLLVPREVFDEHAHFLGDSGSGKTSMGLVPCMEQLLAGGNCSMVVIDLKADSMELLAALHTAAAEAQRRTGRDIPIQHFSNQPRRNTFSFNILTQPYWNDFDIYMRTDILCGALGLQYGTDYGEGYYSSANAAVLYHTIKAYPEATTFRELADRIGYVVSTAKKHELHPEVRKAGVHVQEVLKRLGSFEALNVAPDDARDLASGGPHSPEIAQEGIDLSRPFREPSIFYFHLSASLSPGSSPEIARLATYFLLCAAAQTQRKHRVYLVIDEFQRMVSRNVEYVLQLARSMDVSVILANQSMQDLKTSTADLIPAIEANCRYRQWFSVSASADRERLANASGQTIDYLTTRSSNTNANGGTSSSVSRQEVLLSRLSPNDILLASDHPHRSIVRISRGAGYAQYGGMPLVVEHDFHITRETYEHRKAFLWPEDLPGTFVPANDRTASEPEAPAGPLMTTEVIGGDTTQGDPVQGDPGQGDTTQSDLFPTDLFGSYLDAKAAPKRSRPRRKKKGDQ